MYKHYSSDLKKRAVNLVIDEGMSISSAADKLRVGSRSIYNWVNETKKSESGDNATMEYREMRKELYKVTAERDLLRSLVIEIAERREADD